MEERLIKELIELDRKIVKITDVLNEDRIECHKQIELIKKQRSTMFHYKDLLENSVRLCFIIKIY